MNVPPKRAVEPDDAEVLGGTVEPRCNSGLANERTSALLGTEHDKTRMPQRVPEASVAVRSVWPWAMPGARRGACAAPQTDCPAPSTAARSALVALTEGSCEQRLKFDVLCTRTCALS